MKRILGIVSVLLGIGILGGSWWLLQSGTISLTTDHTTASPGASPSPSSTLPSCDAVSARPKVPVQAAWEQVVTDYFAAKGMTVSRFDTMASLLDVEQQRVGIHRCAYPDGGESAWTGAVPASALAAVQFTVTHDPYPVTGGSLSFVTLAGDGATWSVVAEGTGP